MKRRIVHIIALALLFCGATKNPADAGSVTTTMPVTATVVAACAVSATGVSFGNFSGADVNANGSVTVTCATSVPYKTSLNAGGHFDPTIGTRAMTGASASDRLPYFLYQDAAHTTQWGDNDVANTYSQGASLSGTGTGAAQTLTVFGVATNTGGGVTGTPPAGSYSDTVTVTVTF